jgi:hypothetical protein
MGTGTKYISGIWTRNIIWMNREVEVKFALKGVVRASCIKARTEPTAITFEHCIV